MHVPLDFRFVVFDAFDIFGGLISPVYFEVYVSSLKWSNVLRVSYVEILFW